MSPLLIDWQSCTVGVDVARRVHAMRLSSTNVIVEVRVVKWVLIAAASLFAENGN